MKTLEEYLADNGSWRKKKIVGSWRKKKIVIPHLIDGTQSVRCIVKIPENEKQTVLKTVEGKTIEYYNPAKEFLRPLEAPRVIEETTAPDTFFAFLKSLLSKYPKYDYLYCTKSKYTKKRQYFFKDTTREVVVVMTLEEIKYKIN